MDNTTTLTLQEKFKSPHIVIPPSLVDVTYCVFKLLYNEKYVVIMGKSLYRQVEIIRYNLAYYFSRGDNKVERKNKSDEDYCIEFYKHVKENPGGKFSMQLIFSNPSPYKLLQQNQIALDASDECCLNTNTEPIVSRFIQTPNIYLTDKQVSYKKNYMWINRGHYLNFRKWQYNRSSKPNKNLQ